MADSASTPEMTAHYASPSGEKNFAYRQSTISVEASSQDRTAYLKQLCGSVVEMQREINAFLTKKMDDGKAAAHVNGNGVNRNKVDEDKEEENYGEEVDDEP